LRGRRVDRVSFLDPSVPAWFEALVDPSSGRTFDLRMTAAAHFMRESYSSFDRPLGIAPPG